MKKILMIFLSLLFLFSIPINSEAQQTGTIWVPNTYGYMIFYNPDSNSVIYPMADVVFIDDFLGDAIDMVMWDSVGTDSSEIIHSTSEFTDGGLRFTVGDSTSTVNEAKMELTSELRWYAGKGACAEFIVANQDNDSLAWCVGYSSLQQFGDDSIAVFINSNDSIVTRSGVDFAGFVYDSDATTASIYAVSYKDGTVQPDSLGVSAVASPTEGIPYRLRLEIDLSGNIVFYVNNDYITQIETGITTTTALCLYAGVLSRGQESDAFYFFDLDKVTAWQRK